MPRKSASTKLVALAKLALSALMFSSLTARSITSSLRLELGDQRHVVDLDAGAHGGGERHGPHVRTLGRRRLQAQQGLDHGPRVLVQLVAAERYLSNAGLHDAGFLDPELDAARLELADRLGDIISNRADLGVRHQSLG